MTKHYIWTKAWESPAACCQEIFLISQEFFKEKQDIKNEAPEVSLWEQ